jgi:hypothetical protein
VGVKGWDEFADGVLLRGFVTRLHPVVAADGDWAFHVDPAPGFRHLLRNVDGYVNTTPPEIECEIEPPENLGSDDAEDDSVMHKYFDRLPGRWVTVVGTWVRDRSHSVWDNSIVFGGETGKTEIHPITSILLDLGPAADNRSRRVELFVFSDDSASSTPHLGENRHATFDMPIPVDSPTPTIVSEFNLAAGKSTTLTKLSRHWVHRITVDSGKPDDGKGFYHAVVKLPGYTVRTFLLSRGLDPAKGVRSALTQFGTKSVRQMFSKKK